MGVITDLLLALPIGIIYNMIIHESADIFNNKFNYKDKVQRSLLMVFGGGLIGMIITMFIIPHSVKNTAVRYGLCFGSTLLLFHSIIYNWQIMQNDTRIIVMILTLCVLIWYSYTSNHDMENEDYNKKDKKKKNKTLIY
jgi:low temperature requirement protein LtrA